LAAPTCGFLFDPGVVAARDWRTNLPGGIEMNADSHAGPFAPHAQFHPRQIAESFPHPIIDQCCRRMESAVANLLGEALAEATWSESYDDALHLLESVPLDSEDFALARHRLQNAFDYCLDGEFGAACFELRQLRSLLAAL
jgi:hypothetical protein